MITEGINQVDFSDSFETRGVAPENAALKDWQRWVSRVKHNVLTQQGAAAWKAWQVSMGLFVCVHVQSGNMSCFPRPQITVLTCRFKNALKHNSVCLSCSFSDSCIVIYGLLSNISDQQPGNQLASIGGGLLFIPLDSQTAHWTHRWGKALLSMLVWPQRRSSVSSASQRRTRWCAGRATKRTPVKRRKETHWSRLTLRWAPPSPPLAATPSRCQERPRSPRGH